MRIRYPRSPRQLLVALPNWVGDVVLATPVLAAIRDGLPGAHITFLARRYVAGIVAGGGWHDDELHWPARAEGLAGFVRFVRRIARGRFDAALLLTNSFRSALLTAAARVPRRIGYARDGRSLLLSDRLAPLRRDGRFVPTPMLGYYADLARRIGCEVRDPRLRLGITPEQETAGAELKHAHGLTGVDYAVFNPGAAYGAAKCWPAERFAAVCDRVARERRLRPVVVGADNETPLMREITRRTECGAVCVENPGTTLGSLKPLIRDARLLVCNDTGPRHYGNAFGIPTVTIFGPTFQEWTDTGYAGERKLQARVECGPCMLRVCPIDHRCMTEVTVEAVMDAIADVLAKRPGGDSPLGAIERAVAQQPGGVGGRVR